MYLLPCLCGRQLSVSSAQAGQTVQCECGQAVEVPTMRGLRELEVADARSAARAENWGDRQRVTLGLFIASLGCLAVAAYLAIEAPAPAQTISAEQAERLFENSTPGEVMQVYQDLQRGLTAVPTLDEGLLRQGRMMRWGAGAAVALGVVLAVAAVARVRRPTRI
jgi:cytochrome c-type biogenesis protein CcmH/NrfG